MQSPIPLATLNARIDETFPKLSVRTQNCLQNAGIDHLWQLLVQTEASVFKIKDLGPKSFKEVKKWVIAKGWKLGAFYPQCKPLTEQIWISSTRWIQAINAIGPDGADFAARYNAFAQFLALHGLHTNMTIDELFVYVPTERPPLTEAQVAFLHQLPEDTFAEGHELTWCRAFFNGNATQIVFDIVVILPHLRNDDEHKDVIARIRARIEAEVGPLPLALSSDELRHFFR